MIPDVRACSIPPGPTSPIGHTERTPEPCPQPSLWEALLPEELKRFPVELAQVDAYLDDERFIAPWRALFDRRLGRPSVPIDTLLQLLFSKHRCGLGYKSLCRDVSDSISWRRFCRIGLDRPVPHPTTLVKLARRAGPTTVEQLNGVLLGKLGEDKLLGPHAAGGHHRGGGRHRLADRRRPAGARGSEGRTMARSMRRVITSAWGVSP